MAVHLLSQTDGGEQRLCGECQNAVNNVVNIECCICRNIYHIKCAKMTKNDHRHMSAMDRMKWFCDQCINLFPFNHISVHDKFIAAISSTGIQNIPDYTDLVFNPLEINDNESNIPIDEIDPDSYFYGLQQNIRDMCNSNYYTDEMFLQLANRNDKYDKKLSMMHCNIRSLSQNCDNLDRHLQTLPFDFDVIAITESWLNVQNDDNNYLHDYQHICKYRQHKKGGGVSLFVKKQFRYNERADVGVFNSDIESIFIELHIENENIIIGTVYRPPNTNIDTFLEEMSTMLYKCNKEKKKIYILGDYNLDLLKHDTHNPTNDFLELMYSNSLLPLINRPTRVTCNTATLIDNIFTNSIDNNHSISGIYPADISDHFPIFHLTFNHKCQTYHNALQIIRVINDITLNNFRTKLALIKNSRN